MYMYIYICIYIYLYNIYIYVCICIYIYTHTHTHIYRASAPLTLTGERADGTVASEDSTRPPAEDRLRGVRTTKLLQMSTLLQVMCC